MAEVLRRIPFDEACLKKTLQASTWAKHAAHGIDAPDFQPPQRAMYQIGG